MGRCKERSGVLFNHPCEQEATLNCTVCNKPICERHLRHIDDKPACMTCVREHLKERRSRGDSMGGHYRDDPYFFFYYGGHGWYDEPYNANDYDLFDEAPAAHYATEGEGAWAGS